MSIRQAGAVEPLPLSLFPLLASAFAIVLIRHNWIIRALGKYLTNERAPFLGLTPGGTLTSSVDVPRHWYRSKSLNANLRRVLLLELLGAFVLLCGPAFPALYFVRHHIHRALLWADVAALVVALIVFGIELYVLVFLWDKDGAHVRQ